MLLSRQTPLPMCSVTTEILRRVRRYLLQIPHRRHTHTHTHTKLIKLQHMLLCVTVCDSAYPNSYIYCIWLLISFDVPSCVFFPTLFRITLHLFRGAFKSL